MYGTQEQRIIERLRSALGSAVHVDALRELERVPQLRQRAPAVWVIYDGYRPGADIANVPHVQQVVQEWFIVVAARSARGNGEVDDARDQAATICEQVIEALLGFDLGSGKRLRLAEAPGPEYDSGYCHVPLAFTCAATFKGTL